MPLTETAIRNALRKAALACRSHLPVYDAGMLVLAQPTGKGWWRFPYRFNGEKSMSLGVYPTVSLAAARRKRNTHREEIAAGIDPSAKRQADHRR